jgi:ATP-dependent RNA helicase SUPV3L1/SUV3
VLYRTAGYRVCGERAVRVDILERLADLIRPALSWREGASGVKPSGAFPGGGFTVFNGMTSLTGASGEDFASILRSLGYRMERRPKPQEPKVEPAPAVAAPEVSIEPQPMPATESEAVAASDADHEVSHEALQAPVEAALQPAADLVTVNEMEAATSAAETTGEAAETAGEAAQPSPSAAPELVEVWRPGRAGRPEGKQRRPRFKRRDAGRGTAKDGPQQAGDVPNAAAAENAGQTVQQAGATEEKKPERHQRHHQRPRSEQRFDRRQGDRDRPSRERDRPSGKPAHFERRDREKAPDPNSPFAKLAALKAQLEADAKERR